MGLDTGFFQANSDVNRYWTSDRRAKKVGLAVSHVTAGVMEYNTSNYKAVRAVRDMK